MSKIVIDGFFLTEEATGVQRYALEILKELDRIWNGGEIEMAVPPDVSRKVSLQRIRTVPVGRRSGDLWEQIDLARYLKKEKAFAVYFENVFPIFYRKDLAVIHDVSLKANPQYFNGTLRGKVSVLWRRLNYWIACHSGMTVVTVSDFSRKEINQYYHTNPGQIAVIHNAWQHMDRISADQSVFERDRRIRPGEYYFALSSLAHNKNFAWIVRAARNHPKETFVIGGGGNFAQFIREQHAEGLENLLLLGYIPDGQAKALMAHCKAFLFPSLYEGFGIPPMEAVASGADSIVLSDIPVLREIYGEAGNYINPHDPEGRIPELKRLNEAEKKTLLDRYSWEKSAREMKALLTDKGEK